MFKRFRKNTKKRGVTLFEILIFIVLVSLLIYTSSLGVLAQVKKGRDGKRKADLEKIKIALYDYFFDFGCFPKDLIDCGETLSIEGSVYIDNFPCDPLGGAYAYETQEAECSNWFKVLTNLENIRDQSIDKVGCHNGCGQPNCDYNYGVTSSNVLANKGCVTYYACTPGRECAAYNDPWISQCPVIFENDPDCQGACEQNQNRCHDSKGKRAPDHD